VRLMTDLELEAIWLSTRIAVYTVLVCLPLAVLVASWAGRRRGPGRWMFDALLLLPMSLSPAVVGWAVLRVFGADGPIGSPMLDLAGWYLTLVPDGLILVAASLSLPLMVRVMRPAFETVDTGHVMTARTLGASRWSAWWHITVAQTRPALLSALALGFASAWGESGASLVLAGALQASDPQSASTGTVPLTILSALQTEPGQHIGLRLCLISLGVAMLASLISEWTYQHWRRQSLPSGARGAAT
jgi:molybdate transport system permease protein